MDIEKRTIDRVFWRLIPFLVLCYFAAYLDRVNVGFAALTMNKDLGLSSSAFGLGAGIFFLTYFVFEIPSNLFLERFGARKWIARIMLTWGVVSAATAFISGGTGFYVVRLLLGVAEAGFFPGIIFYLTLWFPAVYRARMIGLFMAAIPLSSVIGAPISGLLLGLEGAAGLHGWQWLFILEALPAVILSGVVFTYLTDRPADATWLPADERAWLVERLAAEERQRRASRHFGVRDALTNGKVWALAFVYFGAVATNYGLSFFLPQIIKAFGLSNAQTGFVTAIPYVVGTLGMIWWGRRSDKVQERRWHVAIPLLVAAGGLIVSTVLPTPTLKILSISVAGFGIFACLPVIWTLPTAFLSGAAAAGGIAMVNAVGNLSGFLGPYAMGFLKDATGSFSAGLIVIAGAALVATGIVLSLTHDARLEREPRAQPAE
jgi:D-galactonate transporter